MNLNPKVRPNNYIINIIGGLIFYRDRVKHWEKIYDKHGEDGLKRQYRKHTYKERIDNALNEKYLEYINDYLVVGGIPEVVNEYLKNKNY